MTKSRGILPPRRRFTWVERELVRRNYADMYTAALAHVLGREVGQIHQLAQRMGLHKSRETIAAMARERATPDHPNRATRFQPGHVPANKGLRRPGYAPGNMAATQFRQGNRPHTWVPVGSYRVNGDGYLDRKMNDLPGPNHVRWHPVHRLVWEQAHGPVPHGHVVVFKPGRRSAVLAEITLDAVELVTRRELMARNSIASWPKELANLVRLRGALNRQINQRSKRYG